MADNKRQRNSKPYDRPERDRAPDGQWLHDRAPKDSAAGHKRAPLTGLDADVSPKLVVSNLHYEVSDRDLSTAFGAYGAFAREPFVRYDRSGRSTGVGVVIFMTANEAAHAKSQMQGVVLKGEAIDIKYERFIERVKKDGQATSSDPSSLLNRIGKLPLKDRISDPDAEDVPMETDSGPGPIRSRGQRAPRANTTTSRGSGRQPGRAKRPAKTADDLDKELDNYADGSSGAKTGGDVEMTS